MIQACLLAGAAFLPLHQDGDTPVRVLFLGDQGHHRPSALAAAVRGSLERRGITLDYTEDVSRLSKEGLADHDVLLVYANIDSLPSRPRPRSSHSSKAAGRRAALRFVLLP
jgi:hypothetical protein